MLEKVWRKGNPLTLLVGLQTSTATMENSAWGWCTGTTQWDGMGREGGSGWVTHVYLWQIHFDIWQNQYNIVKLKNTIKNNI